MTNGMERGIEMFLPPPPDKVAAGVGRTANTLLAGIVTLVTTPVNVVTGTVQQIGNELQRLPGA